jgi:hypothetical protein
VDDASTESRARLRVVLVGCTGLLGDIIGRAVASEADLDVVAQLPAPQAAEALPMLEADLVLWDDADEDRVAQWLSQRSHRHCPRVLTTVYDGRVASLWELVPRRTELGALSPATLVETIRGAATPPGESP